VGSFCIPQGSDDVVIEEQVEYGNCPEGAHEKERVEREQA